MFRADHFRRSLTAAIRRIRTFCGWQELVFAELARLFWHLAPALATQSEPLAELPVRWSGTKSTRRV
jgi:acyl-CoA reductase-like NAD-dependent aldehyde dehydrogenase